ncbi:hypothetical protein KP509_21G033600 [Ceratopteris richardii]|uniref:DNA replication complex GINS protein PSF1 n=1 Tax=Ceratopteris richardii TaxID=49495 RepID=A0A8T2SBX2_CERRI|nr:hypothetical protein KP509_21G033600 [Ceratopteris richardii]
MFGRRGAQLCSELAQNDDERLHRFDNDLFEHVIEEANEHYHQLETRMVKMQQEGLDIETTQNRDYFGALIHHLSLIRNKRCLMSYVYNRSQSVQRLRWQLGAVLPADLQDKLNYSEIEFFKNYSELLGSYMTNIDLDLTVDSTPPKDPYIQVRVMDDLGEVLLDDQATTLLRNSIHLMKRTEAEPLISQGLLEEFIG